MSHFHHRRSPQLRAAVAFSALAACMIPLASRAQTQADAKTPVGDAQPSTAMQTPPVTDAGPSVNDPGISTGDIIVTAQKRAERLQDIPLAVTAVSGAALANQQINDTSSLVRAVPSLTFQQGSGSQTSGFRVRGVGTQLFSLGVEASVSTVIDGVVAARQTQGFSSFADIERIEVLRGPQGTLFGKNATAGVISIVTARPTRTFEASGEATVAEQGEYRFKGTVSGPLSDTLRARLSGYYNDVGGYIRDIGTGRDVNDDKSYGVRGKLEWDATSNLNLMLIGDYRHSNQICCTAVPTTIVNPVVARLTAPVTASATTRQINDNVDPFNKDRQGTVSLQGNWDLGPATITSITAYQQYKNFQNNPIDKINNPATTFVGAGAAYAKFDQNGGTVDLRQVSQELRIGSNGNRTLTYVAGIYYSHLDLDRTFLRARALCAAGTTIGAVCAAPVNQSSGLNATNIANSIAGFAQFEYRLFGGLKAIGGLRLQHETSSVQGTRFAPAFAGDGVIPGNAPVSGYRSTSDTALTGKVGLQYQFDRNAQVYGSYTRGYKGKGFNTELATDFSNQVAVNPEYVNAYEVGFKGKTSDGKLSASIAVFQADYTNLQIQANRSDPTTGSISFVQTNAGTSRTRGVEWEATLQPSSAFSVGFGITYARATVNVDGLNCPLQFQATAPTLTGNFPINQCYRSSLPNAAGVLVTSGPIQNVRNGSLPYAPRVRLSVTPRFEQEVPGTGLVGFVQGSLNFQSRQQFAIEQDPLLVQQPYALVDLSVGAHDRDSRYSISFFVRNLFNEHYFTSTAHNSLLATTSNPYDLYSFVNKDANRYIGGTLGLRFR